MKDYKNKYPINTFTGETRKELEKLIDKVRKETAEEVCDKMIRETSHKARVSRYYDFYYEGYNDRIKEEKEIKQQIIKEL